MYLTSIASSLNMGGYGWYVWPAYGVTMLVLCINILLPQWRHKCLLKQLQEQENNETCS